jgi:hypothetical protein
MNAPRPRTPLTSNSTCHAVNSPPANASSGMRAHCAPVGPGLQSDRAGCHDPGTPQAIEECVARVHATDVTHLAHGRAVDPARSALTQFSRSLPGHDQSGSPISYYCCLQNYTWRPNINSMESMDSSLISMIFSSDWRRMCHFRALSGKSCSTARAQACHGNGTTYQSQSPADHEFVMGHPLIDHSRPGQRLIIS